MMSSNPLALDFYIDNNETIAVTGHTGLGVVAVYDDRDENGLFLRSIEEVRFVRDALDRWITEGGK